jgi:plastocyanin
VTASVLVAAALAGCGGGESKAPAVEADDFAFHAATTRVKAGQTVEWTNTGQTPHTVKGAGFFSKAIDPGATYRHRFDSAGSVKYVCTLHPDAMKGTVVIDG